MNIYQKMAAITAELQTVAKNLTVETGKGKSYKAVSERDVIDAVKPIEAKHGVYSYPADREVLEAVALESESEYNGKITKKTTFFSRIKTVYRFVNVDDPQDFIETVTFAEGIDAQDKGSGKAMTYADKYALMKAYKISTGDDPDQTASVEENYSRATNKAPAVSYSTNDLGPICSDCGADITVREHDYSVKLYNRPLCRRCQAAAKGGGGR
jgi:hypothetical protein